MLYNSYIFILAFLPLVLLLYFVCNKFGKYTAGKLVLIAASFVFAAYTGISNAVVLFISLFCNYCFNYCLRHYHTPRIPKSGILITGILFNILILGIFKYSGVIVDTASTVLGAAPRSFSILLPIGISFYTFQQIAFLVDNYRGEINDFGFLDYCLFSSYFPKLVQGPIPYHGELLGQFNDETKKQFNFDSFSKGIYIFAIGLAKKVLVADVFGKIVDFGYGSIRSLNSFEAILTVLAYTIQLYFDFSGYCDMAQGVSNMLNIELPENFNSPYKAKNISDFWKRWHITLTRFLTKYIYIPLGGNHKGTAKTYINIIIVFLVSGIWHGAGITFIVWGLLHGIASAVYRAIKKPYDKLPDFVQWLLSFAFINVTWVFFRAGSMTDASLLLRQVFSGGWKFAINAELTETLLQPTLVNIPSQFIPLPVVIGVFAVLCFAVCALCKNSSELRNKFKPSFTSFLITFVLLAISILSLSGVSTFLYTNF